MATYSLDSTGRFIGECFGCKKRYYAASADEMRAMSCDCRAASTCRCSNGYRSWLDTEHLGYVIHGHPVTAIKWREVKARKTDRECDTRCTTARGESCACSCAGRNHGAEWAVVPVNG